MASQIEGAAETASVAPLTWRRLFFSFEGRISRRTYILRGQLPLTIVLVVVLMPMIGFGASMMRGDPDSPRSAAAIVAGIVVTASACVVLWSALALAVKRLHDRGRSAWLAILSLVPLIAIWPAVETMFLRGTVGPNRYGAAAARFGRSGSAADDAPPRWRSFFADIGLLLLATLLLPAVFRIVGLEGFNPGSVSMEPTLEMGDDFVVEKFAYGWSPYSIPILRLGFVHVSPSTERLFAAEPKRGDVVVFQLPRDPKISYLKRIIGLPGDRVKLLGGELVLNGEPVARERLDDCLVAGAGRPQPLPRYRETLPDGRSYEVLQAGSNGRYENTPEYVVPAGHVFVLGDYRSDSLDSRVAAAQGGVGFVPLGNLVGRVAFRVYASDGSAPAWLRWTLLPWPTATRWSRVLTMVR